MRHRGSLRRRILTAYVLLATVLCSGFAAAAYLTIQAIEDKLINARLVAAADRLIQSHREGMDAGAPGEPKVLEGSEIPAPLHALPQGVHEIDLNGRALHVLVRGDGAQRVAIVDDESEFERLEGDVWEALAGAVAAGVLLAVALGWITASRVIAPVVALSDAVQNDRLGPDSPSLEATDEVGVLARAFAERSEELHRFLLREQLFTGDVSHELRTPLTIILGAAELLEVRLRDRPELLQPVERIRRTAADTAERVSALLLLSRSPESVDAPLIDLIPLIEHEMDRCRPLLHDKPVELQLDVACTPRVYGRPELAAMAIGNLIRNACQFTERGEVKVLVREGRLEIEDTGMGVPENVKARVFDRFVRAAPDDVPGTGLGLAIVRRVAEHLGWNVELDSRSQGGSRFTIRFSNTKGLPQGFATANDLRAACATLNPAGEQR